MFDPVAGIKRLKMTITLSFGNVMLALLTAAVIIAVFYLVSTLRKIGSFLNSLEPVIGEIKDVLRKSNDVLSRAEQVLEESEEAVREAKYSAARIRGVVDATSNLVEDAIFIFKPVSIISQAFRNGYSLIEKFFLHKDENGDDPEE
jgi:uncharacterized protein YoxC